MATSTDKASSKAKAELLKLVATYIAPLRKGAANILFSPKESSESVLVPKAIAKAADRAYEVRAARYRAQKVVDALQAEETALVEYLIKNVPKSDASGIAGSIARATVNSKKKQRVTDWNKVWAYIFKTKSTDLLQRRLSDEAVESRLEAGKKIPGVESFDVITVSLNKV